MSGIRFNAVAVALAAGFFYVGIATAGGLYIYGQTGGGE